MLIQKQETIENFSEIYFSTHSHLGFIVRYMNRLAYSFNGVHFSENKSIILRVNVFESNRCLHEPAANVFNICLHHYKHNGKQTLKKKGFS